MATYKSNSVPTTELVKNGLSSEEKALIEGTKWGGGYGAGVTLTYSFPGAAQLPSYFASGYGDSEEIAWSAMSVAERAAVRQALEAVSRGADVRFTEVPDNVLIVGELRFAVTASVPDYAFAYYPADYVEAGDSWYSIDWNDGGAVRPGSYEFMTLLHEIGHALGLKHSFSGGAILPDQTDNYLYTVMSYSAKAGVPEWVGADFYPTTLMYLDLVALERLYGPSTTANPGDTTYVFREGRTYWEAVCDSGGIDTITYVSSRHGGLIDLSSGEFSHMGRAVHFTNGQSTRDTISLGPSTVIENAKGGSADDVVIGNRAANELWGRAGDDLLRAGAGNDCLKGGGGADRLLGGSGNDRLGWHAADARVNGGGGTDTLELSAGNLDLTNVADSTILDVEKIDMKKGGDHTLTLGIQDVLAISSSTDTLTVMGNAGDTVILADSFSDRGLSGGYRCYRAGDAILLVETEVTVIL